MTLVVLSFHASEVDRRMDGTKVIDLRVKPEDDYLPKNQNRELDTGSLSPQQFNII